jgi:hypothetical protein
MERRTRTLTPWEEEALRRYPKCEGHGLEMSAQNDRNAFCQGAQYGIAWAAKLDGDGIRQLEAALRIRHEDTDHQQ